MRIRDNYLLMSSEPFSNFSNYVLYPTGAMLYWALPSLFHLFFKGEVIVAGGISLQ